MHPTRGTWYAKRVSGYLFFFESAPEGGEAMLQPRKAYLPNQLNMRVNDDLLAWLVAKSEAARMPPSTYARKIIEATANRDLQKAGVQNEDHEGI
jgi:hypothetical protein